MRDPMSHRRHVVLISSADVYMREVARVTGATGPWSLTLDFIGHPRNDEPRWTPTFVQTRVILPTQWPALEVFGLVSCATLCTLDC